MNEDGQAYKNTLAMTTMERDSTYLVPKPPSHGHSPSSSPCHCLHLLYRRNAFAVIGCKLPVATVVARALLAINTKACMHHGAHHMTSTFLNRKACQNLAHPCTESPSRPQLASSPLPNVHHLPPMSNMTCPSLLQLCSSRRPAVLYEHRQKYTSPWLSISGSHAQP